jgi:soluble lytic murein transglycosylase-like protein
MGITDQIAAEAQAQGLNPALAIEVASAESNLNPNIPDSPAGAIGLFQLEPATAAALGVDPRDPAQNIHGGIVYLRSLLSRFAGNVASALAAYNAGETVVADYLVGTNKSGKNPNRRTTPNGIPPFAETQSYVAKILRGLAQYQPALTPASVANGVQAAATQFFATAPSSADEVSPTVKVALLTLGAIGVYWLAGELSE